jgi:hypothetical protein
MEVSGQIYTPAALTPEKKASGIHGIGDWVSPRAGLDAIEKGKISYPCR